MFLRYDKQPHQQLANIGHPGRPYTLEAVGGGYVPRMLCNDTLSGRPAIKQQDHSLRRPKFSIHGREETRSPHPERPLYNDMSTISLMSKAKLPSPAGEIYKREVRCPCSTSCDDTDTYLEHKRHCKIHTELQIATSISKRKPSETVANRPYSGFAITTIDSSMVVATEKDKQCPCGERFTNDMQRDSHLRYAKAHRGKSASVPNTKAAAPQKLPPPPARKETTDASLAASFAGLKLKSVEAQDKPSVAQFTCKCGDGFTSQAHLIQHRYDKARCAVRKAGGTKNKKSNTPRPQHQKDEYLDEAALFQKRQYSSAT